VPPPAVVYIEPPRKHAPEYSLWLGGRLGVIAYGGSFFDNGAITYATDGTPIIGNSPETTGNLIRSGLAPALEIDAGARLGKRYIPYVGLELGLVGAGRRFDGGPSTTAGTSFIGVGFRYLAGDVNNASFASDISFGIRKVTLSNDSGQWSMTGLEIFRLGLGAEVRMSNHFTISPMITLSGGAMSDTDGHITFADGTHPAYQDGQSIGTPHNYLVVTAGCGAHFDLFGN
jgi:hypothetical protein